MIVSALQSSYRASPGIEFKNKRLVNESSNRHEKSGFSCSTAHVICALKQALALI